MAHEVTMRADGTYEAMFARKPAWWGGGTVVQDAPTGREALRIARMDWNVIKENVYRRTPDGSYEVVPGTVALVRDDNNVVLATASDTYGVLQNGEAVDAFDALNPDGLLKYESALSLRGGRIIILLARMPGYSEVAGGDALARYVMFQTSHDGSSNAVLLPTFVRVVCANTWRMALAAGSAFTFRIRHTRHVRQRVDDAVATLRRINEAFDGDLGKARAMARHAVSEATFKAYLDEIVPEANEKTGIIAANTIKEIRNDISLRFHDGACQKLPEIRGSLWAAFNAVTEHVDHSKLGERRAPRGENRTEALFTRRMFGSGNDLKDRAWKVANEILVPSSF